MHITIVTPTHDVTWLDDAWASLKAQTYTDWDWLILPNGGARVPADIASDDRVSVLPEDWTVVGNVGALKRKLCDRAIGPVIIELDHDDILTPDCLVEVALAIDDAEQPVFVYSDFVQFWPEHQSHVFDAANGWETRPFEHDGHKYTALRAFEPTAASIRQIYYAPNHVRAWTQAAYALAGGHDPDLPVCDDHDLICRMYLTETAFRHIPKVLYLYRERAHTLMQNSYRAFRDDGTLERVHHRNQTRYTWRLIHSWCQRAGLPMYDLGGRIDCPETYKSIDLHGANINCDVTKGLPFEDSTVGIFRAADFLEHIPREHVVFVMNELWRCLVPGGWVISRTPSTGGKGAFCDPTHASFWNDLSFRYYTDRRYAAYVPEIKCRFEAARVWECYPSGWHKEQDLKYVYADLVALKEGHRHPGLQLI